MTFDDGSFKRSTCRRDIFHLDSTFLHMFNKFPSMSEISNAINEISLTIWDDGIEIILSC